MTRVLSLSWLLKYFKFRLVPLLRPLYLILNFLLAYHFCYLISSNKIIVFLNQLISVQYVFYSLTTLFELIPNDFNCVRLFIVYILNILGVLCNLFVSFLFKFLKTISESLCESSIKLFLLLREY